MRKFVFIIITIVLVLAVANLSFGNTKNTALKVHYQTVEITNGDTLWEIAKENKTSNMSTQEYVLIIKDFNNMKSDKIMVGQNIIIPIYLL